jgi:enoyl-CoA hydratase
MDILQSQMEDGILILKLNRPEKHNCLNQELIEALTLAFSDVKTNSSIRSVLLMGIGPSFCAGADINRLAECDAQSGYDFARFGQSLMDTIESLNKPCVAALHGHVLGGGCELAMSAHLRFAHEKTFLGQPEIKLGVIPGYGGTQRLTRLVGRSKALDLCLTGRFIDATTALSYGLVDKVFGDDLEKQALDYLRGLNQMPSIAVNSILQTVLRGAEMPLAQALDLEALHFSKTCASLDKKEGVQAFLEKRKANFNGC